MAIPEPPPAPRVSVVVASRNALGTMRSCLGSLARQTYADFEVIVVDSSADGTAELVRREFPSVRLSWFAERKYPGDARNIGVEQARGELLAFLDADCVAAPDWLEQIVAAHQAPDAVIGGAVDNANPESLVGWGAYLAEFSQWMPGLPRRRMSDIPTCCLSVKRAAFDAFGPFLQGTYCSDTVFNWKAGEGGEEPLFLPAIRVAHTNTTVLSRLLSKMSMHGKAFARLRVRERKLSAIQAVALCAGGLTVLPLLLLARTLRRVLAARAPLGRALLSSPFLLATLTAWSWGEARGYAAELRST